MIRGFGDLNGNNDKKDDKKKKHNETYQGGTSSGLALDQGNSQDKIVENAKEHSTAQTDKPTTSSDKMVRITLYKNGFECNGIFFNNDDPETKKYLEDMMQSKVSYDFMKKCGIDPKDEKTFELADKRSDDYRPPTPPKQIAFSGESNTIGQTESKVLQGCEDQARPVDSSKKIVNVKVRLPNGKTKSVQFNDHELIAEFYKYLDVVAPVQGKFQLLSGFPPKTVELNKSNSIVELDKKNFIMKLL